MKTRYIAIILFVHLFVFGTVAYAQNYRCGGKIIKLGATKIDLIKNCGEPDKIQTVVSNNRGVMVKQEILLYDQRAKKYAVWISSGAIFRIREYANYNLRCKGGNISAGDSETSVLEKCGPPLDMQEIMFGELSNPEKGKRILYRRDQHTAVVVTKDDEVLYVVIEKAGHR